VLREQEFRATDEDGLSVLGEGAGRWRRIPPQSLWLRPRPTTSDYRPI